MPKVRLAKVSVEDLKKEISRRQRKLPKLIAERDTLNRLIAELEDLGAVKPTAIRRRKAGGRKAPRRAMKPAVAKRAVVKPARAGSLASALIEALKNKKKLSVGEAAGAVQAAGYKSKSKTFQKVVGMMLSKDKRFKRVSRGVYALRG